MDHAILQFIKTLPFAKKIFSQLETAAGKWTAEAKSSVHAYENAQQAIENTPEKNTDIAAITSLYGDYLKDTRESL